LDDLVPRHRVQRCQQALASLGRQRAQNRQQSELTAVSLTKAFAQTAKDGSATLGNRATDGNLRKSAEPSLLAISAASLWPLSFVAAAWLVLAGSVMISLDENTADEKGISESEAPAKSGSKF